MWINNIKFGTYPYGINAGQIGYHIEFSGEKAKDHREIAEAIKVIEEHESNAKKLFITGQYSPDELDMVMFLKAFCNRDYKIVATVNGSKQHSWFKHLHWLVVRSKAPFQHEFYSNELWYEISSTSDPEPLIPQIQGYMPTFLYLIPNDMQQADVFAYIEEAKNNWAILLPTRLDYYPVEVKRRES